MIPGEGKERSGRNPYPGVGSLVYPSPTSLANSDRHPDSFGSYSQSFGALAEIALEGVGRASVAAGENVP